MELYLAEIISVVQDITNGTNCSYCNDLINQYTFIGDIATISLLIFIVAVLVAVAACLGIKVKKLKRWGIKLVRTDLDFPGQGWMDSLEYPEMVICHRNDTILDLQEEALYMQWRLYSFCVIFKYDPVIIMMTRTTLSSSDIFYSQSNPSLS